MAALTNGYLVKVNGAPYTSGGYTRQKVEDAGAIVTEVGDSASASDTQFPTEQAIREMIPSGSDADFDTDEVLSTGQAGCYGLLIVAEKTGGITAVYRVDNQTLTAISAEATFSTTKDNAATYNVYWETDQFKIQNKVGNDKSVSYQFTVI